MRPHINKEHSNYYQSLSINQYYNFTPIYVSRWRWFTSSLTDTKKQQKPTVNFIVWSCLLIFIKQCNLFLVQNHCAEKKLICSQLLRKWWFIETLWAVAWGKWSSNMACDMLIHFGSEEHSCSWFLAAGHANQDPQPKVDPHNKSTKTISQREISQWFIQDLCGKSW